MLRFPRDIQLKWWFISTFQQKENSLPQETYPQKVLFFESMCAFCQKGIAEKTLDKTAKYLN